MSANYEGYINVLGEALREIVLEAMTEPRDEFRQGYLTGLHRVVTLMQQTAETYEIPPEALGVANIQENQFF